MENRTVFPGMQTVSSWLEIPSNERDQRRESVVPVPSGYFYLRLSGDPLTRLAFIPLEMGSKNV